MPFFSIVFSTLFSTFEGLTAVYLLMPSCCALFFSDCLMAPDWRISYSNSPSFPHQKDAVWFNSLSR